ECTGTHKITQADLDSGSFADTGSVTSEGGTKAEDKEIGRASCRERLWLTEKDDLKTEKYDHVGQVVTYTLVATNEGNTTLQKVEVSDLPAIQGFTYEPSTSLEILRVHFRAECTGTHKITQADLDSGSFADTGSVTSEGGTKAEDKDKVEADQKPKLGLTKKDDLNPAKYDHVGQVVTYTLVATNEGNTTLHRSEERRAGKAES